MKIIIQNGHVINPANQLNQVTDVYIDNGLIVALGGAPKGFVAEQTIDASDCWVLPGVVDLCARLREPGEEYKATLSSELKAAVAGGVTSLACAPDTDPVLDEPGLVEMLKHRAKSQQLAHVYPLGALTRQLQGQQLTEMYELTAAGCVGFSQADIAITDTQVLWRAFEYAATFGYRLFLRAEDPYLAKNGVAHEGEVASRLGLKGIPVAAESIALQTLIRIAQSTQTPLHICRLSTSEGVDLVRKAKQQGINISADVSIQHLHLTDMDVGYFNSMAHIKPPLRSQRDQAALTQGLIDGTIDAICSDHSPVDDDAKLVPFAESQSGASALELLLPLTLKWATQHNIDTNLALSKITHQPASVLKLKAGNLALHEVADIVVFNPHTEWQISPDKLVSRGKNTPFLRHNMMGKVSYTLTKGLIAYSAKI